MKKNLKYFENELNRINKEFAEYKKQHMEKPKIGKTVEIAGMEWMILDKTEKGYFAVLNGFDGKERAFDSDSNNWISSKLREELNTNPEDMFHSSMVYHAYIGMNNYCNRCGQKLGWREEE